MSIRSITLVTMLVLAHPLADAQSNKTDVPIEVHLAPGTDCLDAIVGVSKTTMLRFRKRKMLTTVNIYARQYISWAEIA